MSEEFLKKNLNNYVLEIGPGTGKILKLFEEKLNCRTCTVELSDEVTNIIMVDSNMQREEILPSEFYDKLKRLSGYGNNLIKLQEKQMHLNL